MSAFDYRRLNIRSPEEAWLCPACGFAGAFNGSTFDERGPQVGTGICPCCTYEPGFDDTPAASGCEASEPIDAIRAYSAAWIAGGERWRGDPSAMPSGWNRAAQRKDWLSYCEPALS